MEPPPPKRLGDQGLASSTAAPGPDEDDLQKYNDLLNEFRAFEELPQYERKMAEMFEEWERHGERDNGVFSESTWH